MILEMIEIREKTPPLPSIDGYIPYFSAMWRLVSIDLLTKRSEKGFISIPRDMPEVHRGRNMQDTITIGKPARSFAKQTNKLYTLIRTNALTMIKTSEDRRKTCKLITQANIHLKKCRDFFEEVLYPYHQRALTEGANVITQNIADEINDEMNPLIDVSEYLIFRFSAKIKKADS